VRNNAVKRASNKTQRDKQRTQRNAAWMPAPDAAAESDSLPDPRFPLTASGAGLEALDSVDDIAGCGSAPPEVIPPPPKQSVRRGVAWFVCGCRD